MKIEYSSYYSQSKDDILTSDKPFPYFLQTSRFGIFDMILYSFRFGCVVLEIIGGSTFRGMRHKKKVLTIIDMDG